MKVLILSDTHHGCHSNDSYHVAKQMEFLDGVSAVVIEKEIDIMVHTGDFNDKKTIIDKKNISQFVNKYNEIHNNLIYRKAFYIVGNHDAYYKQTNEYSALNIFFPNDNIQIVDNEPIEFENLLFVPWVSKYNKDEMQTKIKQMNKKGNYLFGHFEKKGAYMTNSYISEHDSIDPNIYSKYTKVFSGHYHLNQEIDDNWIFVGSPYHINRGDMHSDHGVYVLDTVTHELEFVEISKPLYRVLTITEDECKTKGSIKKALGDIENKIVDIEVESSDEKCINRVIDVVCENNPHKYTLKTETNDDQEINQDNLDGMDNRDIINSYLDIQDYKSDKEKMVVNKMFYNYYNNR